jgi:hypothetical protein
VLDAHPCTLETRRLASFSSGWSSSLHSTLILRQSP